MGPRPMLGLSRRTYPAKCSRCPHAARPTLPAALEGTMVHRCHRPRTGHPREAQPPTRQGLPSCLINRYPFGHQITPTGTSVSAYAPPWYWGRPKAGGNAPRKGSLVRSIETPGQPSDCTKRMIGPAGQVRRPVGQVRHPAGQMPRPEADCTAPSATARPRGRAAGMRAKRRPAARPNVAPRARLRCPEADCAAPQDKCESPQDKCDTPQDKCRTPSVSAGDGLAGWLNRRPEPGFCAAEIRPCCL